MRSEHVDVLRESVALVIRELMEVEVWRSQISRSDYGPGSTYMDNDAYIDLSATAEIPPVRRGSRSIHRRV
jgi:hypothetical protein